MMNTRHGPICVSIGVASQQELLALVNRCQAIADVIEIRLDCLDNPDPAAVLAMATVPLLFTNRPVWEGGHFSGTEQERLRPLLQAVEAGAAYIDCELRAPRASRLALRQVTQRSDCRLLISWHDFTETPSWRRLSGILTRMHKAGDIGKIVTTARQHLDVLRVLRLQEKAAALSFPLIAFAMGQAGTISRLATLALGGYMTYCAATPEAATAPGQLTIDQLRALHALLPPACSSEAEHAG